ncbi:MAG: thioredoxin fold domain-containing protein [Pseudomonadota bacterium]
MLRTKLIPSLFLAAVTALPVQAADVQLPGELKKTLQGVFGGQPDRVVEAPVEGLLEVTYDTNIFYVSRDGRHLINGEMFDLSTRTNLTEQRLSGARLKAMDQMDEASMIVYPAKGEEQHTITVFTDIDCGYCRKLHQGMDEMNELGITVRYLAYPRAGVGSPSYDKAVKVWCAEDRNKAMDLAKAQQAVKGQSCADNPVRAQMRLGEKVGVTGTPAIVLSDGKLMPGYAPPEKLAALLEKQASAQ